MSWIKPPVWSPNGWPYPAPNGPNYPIPTGPIHSTVPPEIDHTRRIIDLETRIAAIEAALDKLTGESK